MSAIVANDGSCLDAWLCCCCCHCSCHSGATSIAGASVASCCLRRAASASSSEIISNSKANADRPWRRASFSFSRCAFSSRFSSSNFFCLRSARFANWSDECCSTSGETMPLRSSSATENVHAVGKWESDLKRFRVPSSECRWLANSTIGALIVSGTAAQLWNCSNSNRVERLSAKTS